MLSTIKNEDYVAGGDTGKLMVKIIWHLYDEDIFMQFFDKFMNILAVF